MKLLSNWREILWRAWSVRLLALAALLSGVEVLLPLVQDYLPISRGWFALASLAITFGAVFARLVAQKSIGAKE